MRFPTYIVDAFVQDKKFSGSPAGVVFLEYDDDVSDGEKQQIASELNQPITAFVSRGWTKGTPLSSPVPNRTRWAIRWFTSTLEYPLCGHASLATAKLIFSHYVKQAGPGEAEATIELDTKCKGVLSATVTWSSGLLTLNFPQNIPTPLGRAENPWIEGLLLNTLGPRVSPDFVDQVLVSTATNILIIHLKNGTQQTAEGFIKQLDPNFGELVSPDTGSYVLKSLLIVVTVRGEEGSRVGPDFYSRVFCPAIGYNEDNACGSAHTILAPYWTPRLNLAKGDSQTVHGRQVSPRGSDFYCTLTADGRVTLSGNARPTLSGELIL